MDQREVMVENPNERGGDDALTPYQGNDSGGPSFDSGVFARETRVAQGTGWQRRRGS
jgi:hypothetical protein